MNSKSLCRLPEKGKIGGVCAGIAAKFNLEAWFVRFIFIGVFILGAFFLASMIYLTLWCVLDKAQLAEPAPQAIKRKAWQAGSSAKDALQDTAMRFKKLDYKLKKLERYVTSDQFELKREINNL